MAEPVAARGHSLSGRSGVDGGRHGVEITPAGSELSAPHLRQASSSDSRTLHIPAPALAYEGDGIVERRQGCDGDGGFW